MDQALRGQILDKLDQYGVKATFYSRSYGAAVSGGGENGLRLPGMKSDFMDMPMSGLPENKLRSRLKSLKSPRAY